MACKAMACKHPIGLACGPVSTAVYTIPDTNHSASLPDNVAVGRDVLNRRGGDSKMSTREIIGFCLFVGFCLAFIGVALLMVGIISTNELRLNQ